MGRRRRALVAAVLGGLLACTTTSALAAGWSEWLPQGEVFRQPLAANLEALNYLSFVSLSPEDGETFTAGLTSLGLDFPAYRLRDSRWGGDWQIGFFAGAQSQFNMSQKSDPLLNTDYFIGFPLSFRNQRWSARARLFHQSSHLGDELLLSDEPPEREDLSYEAADLLVAYTWPGGWRVYAGGAYILSSDWEALGHASGHSGVDYLSPRPLLWGGRLVLALDNLAADAFDPDTQWRLLAGLRYGAAEPGGNAVTAGLQAFHGPIPFGQFFEDSQARYVGAIAIFDLD